MDKERFIGLTEQFLTKVNGMKISVMDKVFYITLMDVITKEYSKRTNSMVKKYFILSMEIPTKVNGKAIVFTKKGIYIIV